MLASRKTSSAEKRLLEALLVGENLPEMLSLPADQRNSIQTFRQACREGDRAVEVKDFTRAEEKNNAELSKMASDSRPLLRSRRQPPRRKSESNLGLAEARTATTGDKEMMEAGVKLAATVLAAESRPRIPARRPSRSIRPSRAKPLKNWMRCSRRKLTCANRGETRNFHRAWLWSTRSEPSGELRAVMAQPCRNRKRSNGDDEYDQQGIAGRSVANRRTCLRKYSSDPKLIRAVSGYTTRAPIT